MDFLHPRDPVSTWSHGFWLLLALPGVFLLWRRGSGDRAKQISLLIYGVGLVACSTTSTLFHGLRPPFDRLRMFDLLDYLGIYLLIAGSYTPIAWNVPRG